jgi:arylsulfatase A-like enzyme
MCLQNVNKENSKPNILFIFADQLRYDSLGSSGNKVIKTPNLDRLASEGAALDNAFSCCPICSPYRAQILTGRYAHKNGVIQNDYEMHTNQITYPQKMNEAGYRTAHIGKWHLGRGPYTKERRYGFDYMYAYNCDHIYYNVEYFENEKGPIKTKDWSPEVETSKALEFMKRHLCEFPDRPFSLHLGYAPPHNNTDNMYSESTYNHGRYQVYPQEYNIYSPDEVPMSPNVPTPLAEFARKEIADYYGNITALDDQVGRILEYLDKSGLRDNTIVVFTSDHGDHLRSHGYGVTGDLWMHPSKRINKATPYEEAVHIPFIMRYPKMIKEGERPQIMFNSVDVMPTLLGLCEIDIPEGVQGHDLSHTMRGESGYEPDSVYMQILGRGWHNRTIGTEIWRAVRTSRWTYTRFLPMENIETNTWLFDRETDPYELNNLSGLDEYSDIESGLEKRLKQWMIETDDPFDHGRRNPVTRVILDLE